MGYPAVGILGFGKMAADCAQILLNQQVKVNFVLETEESPFSSLDGLCYRSAIFFERATGEKAAEFLNGLDEPTVILSINNNFLFPPHIVRKRNLRIVNFHNALLPSYRGHGQSIPRWIVYNGETRHGVTWHLVDEKIDSGNILCNKTFSVLDTDTALSVMMRSIKVGIALFEQWWKRFLDFRFQGMSQGCNRLQVYKSPLQNRLYGKKHLPNNGQLDPSWGFDQSIRFLRSMDYSRLQIIASPKIAFDNEVRSIKKYKVKRRPFPVEEEKNRGWVRTEQIRELNYEKGVITLYLQPENTPA
ncbi:MAG: hypothetical protein C4576_34200 [Desulfobacteraceae bacterium]|nr:MAG: hypothetical protein C4576_34200 [Desulfobacteraceae bacterium]